jgi:hypothetical protein
MDKYRITPLIMKHILCLSVVGGWWFLVFSFWFLVFGLWFVVCGLWFVVCGLWFVES